MLNCSTPEYIFRPKLDSVMSLSSTSCVIDLLPVKQFSIIYDISIQTEIFNVCCITICFKLTILVYRTRARDGIGTYIRKLQNRQNWKSIITEICSRQTTDGMGEWMNGGRRTARASASSMQYEPRSKIQL